MRHWKLFVCGMRQEGTPKFSPNQSVELTALAGSPSPLGYGGQALVP